MDIRINSSVDVDILVDRLVEQLTHDDLFEFIKTLDFTVCDWDFTDKLIEHFTAEKAKKVIEIKDYSV